MTYVTDTHALVHHVTDRKRRLGQKARGIFDRADRGSDTIIVPFTVLEEILLLSEDSALVCLGLINPAKNAPRRP